MSLSILLAKQVPKGFVLALVCREGAKNWTVYGSKIVAQVALGVQSARRASGHSYPVHG